MANRALAALSGLFTYGIAYWLYNAYPRVRRRLAIVLLLIGGPGLLLTAAIGLRIVLRALGQNEAFMICMAIFSAAALLVGSWIAILEDRARRERER